MWMELHHTSWLSGRRLSPRCSLTSTTECELFVRVVGSASLVVVGRPIILRVSDKPAGLAPLLVVTSANQTLSGRVRQPWRAQFHHSPSFWSFCAVVGVTLVVMPLTLGYSSSPSFIQFIPHDFYSLQMQFACSRHSRLYQSVSNLCLNITVTSLVSHNYKKL